MRRGTRQVIIGGCTRYLDLVGQHDNRFDAQDAADKLRPTHFVRVMKYGLFDYRVFALLNEDKPKEKS